MPETLPPPPAPPAGVNIVPSSRPPKPPPPPTREIKLGSPSRPPPPPVPPADPGPGQPPPKPGSARERLSQALQKKVGGEETPPPATPRQQTPPAPGEGETIPPEGETAPPDPGTPPDPKAQATPPADPKAGKSNPWKVVDHWKAKYTELEKKVAESSSLPEAKQKEYLSQIETLQKRNEQLENEMRFVNYQESEEFKGKYQKPYEEAWSRAMSELQDIQITDPNTQVVRPATHQDLLEICQLPLNKARELANAVFGDFADDIMAYRKEIKSLFSARESALKEAKETGATRDKTQRELMAKQTGEIHEQVKASWEKATQEYTSDERYARFFTPVEGDQDGNQRLAKGFALVDRAWAENPADPRLTPEQRAAAVRRNAAVRFRAAAFGRVVALLNASHAELEATRNELAQFKGSVPPTGGTPTPPGENGQPATAHDRIFAELRKRAQTR